MMIHYYRYLFVKKKTTAPIHIFSSSNILDKNLKSIEIFQNYCGNTLAYFPPPSQCAILNTPNRNSVNPTSVQHKTYFECQN